MNLQYPSFVVPQPTQTKITDLLDLWDKGVEQGKADRFEREAPEQFAQAAAPLSEFGLSTPPDQLRQMFANPETRPLALQMVQEATQRRADASDPVKQLQLKKAQYDADHLGYQAPTAEQRNYSLASKDPKFAEFIGASAAGKAPAEVQAYMFYRNQETESGKQPLSFLDYKNALKGNGLSVVTSPDGSVSVQQGGTPGAMPKLTEGQSKDVVYLTKGAGALPTIDEFGDALTDPIQQVMGVDPTGVVRGRQNPAFQQAEQAGKEFLAAVLRKDTGAAVTRAEEDMYGAMYLPRPGDTKELLAQKKEARGRALKAIELGIPSPAIVEMERRGVLPGGDAENPAGATKATKVVGGVTYYQDANGDWFEQ